MSTHATYYISELHFEGETIQQQADDEISEHDRDNGWYNANNWNIGNFIIREWRSDRNHLEVDITLPCEENHLLAQSLLLIAYQAINSRATQ